MATEENTALAAAEQALKAAFENYFSTLEAETKDLRAIFPDNKMRAIITLIDQGKTLFAPYDHPLTPIERKRLVGTGYKNFGFIEQAYASAAANPSLLPSYLNITTFKNDIDDFDRKRNLDEILKQFELQVSDSMYVASDRAYRDKEDLEGKSKE